MRARRERFERRRDEAEGTQGERFCRMWTYYLDVEGQTDFYLGWRGP